MTDLVLECLRLRRWAVSLLALEIAPSAAVESFPEVTPEAWAFFLAAETFSRALLERLKGHLAGLDARVCRVLEHTALEELKREMAARAQLAVIDGLCDRCGLAPIVLKGGVHVIDGGESFDLTDIDLLLGKADIATLTTTLVTEGGYAFDAEAEQLRMLDGIVVELHDRLEVGYGVPVLSGNDTRPLPGYRRLRRLAPADHLLYCVQHTTTKHPLRRGHLRDVLLIADAMDDCTPAELEAARRLMQASRSANVYLATLAFADAMRAGAPRQAFAGDPFRRTAATKYAAASWFDEHALSPRVLRFDHVAQFVESTAEWGALVGGYLTADFASSRAYSPTIGRYSRRVARLTSLIVRTPFRLMVLGNAFAVSVAVRVRYALHWRGFT